LIRLTRPSARDVDALLHSYHEHSYPEVGRSAELSDPAARHALESAGYAVDVRPASLGRGRALYERAAKALSEWRHFELPWAELLHAHPVAKGQVVATLMRSAGVWLVNPCRVVYAQLDPREDAVAFGYGTLRGHALAGEERFQLRFDPASDEVVYEIAAFSRPDAWYTRLGHASLRKLQARFGVASARALARAISGRDPAGTT
jgi:uncharacterized protein (UPF0548 family)